MCVVGVGDMSVKWCKLNYIIIVASTVVVLLAVLVAVRHFGGYALSGKSVSDVSSTPTHSSASSALPVSMHPWTVEDPGTTGMDTLLKRLRGVYPGQQLLEHPYVIDDSRLHAKLWYVEHDFAGTKADAKMMSGYRDPSSGNWISVHTLSLYYRVGKSGCVRVLENRSMPTKGDPNAELVRPEYLKLLRREGIVVTPVKVYSPRFGYLWILVERETSGKYLAMTEMKRDGLRLSLTYSGAASKASAEHSLLQALDCLVRR